MEKGIRLSKHKLFIFIVLCMVLLPTDGCQSTGHGNTRYWKYTPEPRLNTNPPLISRNIAVCPLSDARGNMTLDNNILLFFIPMPYASYKCDRIDVGQYRFLYFPSPCENISKAIAEDLDSSGIFEEVYFTRGSPLKGELVLRGELVSTEFKAKTYYYFIPKFAMPLWILGLPTGSWEAELIVSLKLEDPETKRVLWSHSFKSGSGAVYGLYLNESPNFYYDIYLKDIMKGVIQSLSKDSVTLLPVTGNNLQSQKVCDE